VNTSSAQGQPAATTGRRVEDLIGVEDRGEGPTAHAVAVDKKPRRSGFTVEVSDGRHGPPHRPPWR